MWWTIKPGSLTGISKKWKSYKNAGGLLPTLAFFFTLIHWQWYGSAHSIAKKLGKGRSEERKKNKGWDMILNHEANEKRGESGQREAIVLGGFKGDGLCNSPSFLPLIIQHLYSTCPSGDVSKRIRWKWQDRVVIRYDSQKSFLPESLSSEHPPPNSWQKTKFCQ